MCGDRGASRGRPMTWRRRGHRPVRWAPCSRRLRSTVRVRHDGSLRRHRGSMSASRPVLGWHCRCRLSLIRAHYSDSPFLFSPHRTRGLVPGFFCGYVFHGKWMRPHWTAMCCSAGWSGRGRAWGYAVRSLFYYVCCSVRRRTGGGGRPTVLGVLF